ncbi:hypothetical protein PY093_10075 [Cytobacillus sp. S13-E01]|uniref:hypothetical protein n=1 Tax=Cytobacillus sp. S13-E01 TaxID=3031326 RepID=UPI0023D7DC0F|nr:hypothetical protein [Cytobacillus sp. S13-E01]MDF0727064.1 hypothetical protein [Cytobacillus sp. S13-E01]
MNKLISSTFKNYPILILISAFAPYVSPTSGIKGDNIVIYSLAIIAVGVLLIRQKFSVNKNLLIIFLIWLSVFIYLSTRTLLGGGYIDEYSLIAEIKNFSQPLAIMLIFLVFIYSDKIESIEIFLKKASLVLISLLSINTLWIFIDISFDLSYINQYFVRGVALNAAGNNRFSGVFNQPMEAGIAYSIGLFSWMYVVSKKYINVNFKYVLMLILLFIGGLVSVSKIFIFGGILLFIINIIFEKKSLMKLKKLLLWIPILLPFLIIYLSNNWQGISYLNRLFTIENYREQGFLYLLSAGRYGGNSSQQRGLLDMIWETSPMIGQGMGSQMIYDSAVFHFFSSGGLIALSMYLLLLTYLLIVSLHCFVHKKSRSETIFFFNIVLLIILATFGAPVLTVNRASVVVWVFISLLLWYINKKSIKETIIKKTV